MKYTINSFNKLYFLSFMNLNKILILILYESLLIKGTQQVISNTSNIMCQNALMEELFQIHFFLK